MRVWRGFGTIQQTVRKQASSETPPQSGRGGKVYTNGLRWVVKFTRKTYQTDKEVGYRPTETEERKSDNMNDKCVQKQRWLGRQ